MHKTLHSIQLIRDYMEAKNLIKYPISNIDDIYKFFIYITNNENKYKFNSLYIFNYIELGQEYAIFEIQVPENWKGKTIGRLDIRQKYNINIMALKIEGRMDMSITSDTVLSGNMTMLVLGKNKDIQKCFHIL